MALPWDDLHDSDMGSADNSSGDGANPRRDGGSDVGTGSARTRRRAYQRKDTLDALRKRLVCQDRFFESLGRLESRLSSAGNGAVAGGGCSADTYSDICVRLERMENLMQDLMRVWKPPPSPHVGSVPVPAWTGWVPAPLKTECFHIGTPSACNSECAGARLGPHVNICTELGCSHSCTLKAMFGVVQRR